MVDVVVFLGETAWALFRAFGTCDFWIETKLVLEVWHATIGFGWLVERLMEHQLFPQPFNLLVRVCKHVPELHNPYLQIRVVL